MSYLLGFVFTCLRHAVVIRDNRETLVPPDAVDAGT